MRKFAILGCGPAGMFAAHALREMGCDFNIYSKRRRSEMFGAQYLHKPIHGLTRSDPVQIDYRLEGGVEGYREKVYASVESGIESVSPEDLLSKHLAWDIREAYYEAYRRYQWKITEIPNINGTWLGSLLRGRTFEAVISTIPAPAICVEGHRFNSVETLAAGDAPERGISVPGCFDCPPNTVICNGDPDELWYRQSNVFGQRTVEWPIEAGVEPPLRPDKRIINDYGVRVKAAVVKKPISRECDCFAEEPLIRMGRYGKWQKGELSHQAYFDTIKLATQA